MTEAQLLTIVKQLAETLGWMVYHTWLSAHSDKGWPDLVLCHPSKRRVLVVELKSDKGQVTEEQHDWLSALHACGIQTAVWRPADLDRIADELNS